VRRPNHLIGSPAAMRMERSLDPPDEQELVCGTCPGDSGQIYCPVCRDTMVPNSLLHQDLSCPLCEDRGWIECQDCAL